MKLSGILNINKPAGVTSFDIVRTVKRLGKEKRVGHGGTLDPGATGVLLVLMGEATRIAEYLLDGAKTYRTVIEMGLTTDTYDSEGEILSKKDPSFLTITAIENALASYTGPVSQEPPMFSALHHQGKRLYELAREGIEVPRRARVRQVYEIRLVDWACPLLTVELKCEGGFYVRSLASDLGQRLGCGASIKELCRLKQGEFSLSESLTVEEVEDAFRNGWVSLAVHPVDTPLIQKKAAILSDVDERHFLQGRVIQLSGPGEPDQPDQAARTQVEPEPTGEVCRVYSAAGYFIAVGKWDEKNGLLHPKKVFCPPGVSKPPSFLTQTGENTF